MSGEVYLSSLVSTVGQKRKVIVGLCELDKVFVNHQKGGTGSFKINQNIMLIE